MADERHPVVQNMIDAVEDVFKGRVVDENGTMTNSGSITTFIIEPGENGGFSIVPMTPNNKNINSVFYDKKISPEWKRVYDMLKKRIKEEDDK